MILSLARVTSISRRGALVHLEKRALLRPTISQLQHQMCFSNESSSSDTAPRRRLRRLKPTRSRWDTEFKMPDTGGLREAFEPDEDNIADYLKKTSLSPWVPTPDPVARRVFDLLHATEDDIHVDLGSGDGRMNFHASDPPYSVKKSIGIDVDTKIVQQAQDRLDKRHPKPPIEFVIDDLKDPNAPAWQDHVANATILTMYFVKEALEEIQPHLERIMLGKKVRIATVGYAMPKSNVGWDPTWVEVILGTPIHIYELGYPMTDRLTPPDINEPVAGSASDMKLQKGRQPFKDEYEDVERGENPLVDPDDFVTEDEEDWDVVPGAPEESSDDDNERPVWRKP